MEVNNVKLNRINKSDIKIEITDYLERKIRILANLYPALEWSGPLFYRIKKNGSFESRTYEAIDALPLNFGSSSYTNFCSDDIRLPEFIVRNGYDEDGIYMGLIHSHNTMGTNASSTDEKTILNECNERGTFMSLIVNNYGKYSCYMSRKVIKKVDMKCDKSSYDFDGNITSQKVSTKEDLTVIECFDVSIVEREEMLEFVKYAKGIYEESEKERTAKIAKYSKPEDVYYRNADLFNPMLPFKDKFKDDTSSHENRYKKIEKLIGFYDSEYISFMEKNLLKSIKVKTVIEFMKARKSKIRSMSDFTRLMIDFFKEKNTVSGYSYLYSCIVYLSDFEDEEAYNIVTGIVNGMNDVEYNSFKRFFLSEQMQYQIIEFALMEDNEIYKSSDTVLSEAGFNFGVSKVDDKSLIDKIIKCSNDRSSYAFVVAVRAFAVLYNKDKTKDDKFLYEKSLELSQAFINNESNYNINDYGIDSEQETFLSALYDICSYLNNGLISIDSIHYNEKLDITECDEEELAWNSICGIIKIGFYNDGYSFDQKQLYKAYKIYKEGLKDISMSVSYVINNFAV
jgi:hypothetical protein